MKKKNLRKYLIGTTVILSIALLSYGLVFKILLPKIRYENSIKGFQNYLMCYRCINSESKLSQRELKKRIISEMKVQELSLDDVKKSILEKKKHDEEMLNNPRTSSEYKKFIKDKAMPYYDRMLDVLHQLQQQ